MLTQNHAHPETDSSPTSVWTILVIVVLGILFQISGAYFLFKGFPEITVINAQDTRELSKNCTKMGYRMALYDFTALKK